MCKDFSSVATVLFPRLALDISVDIEVHGFSDASNDAYGACFYILSRNPIHFMSLKSRVAPLKRLTTPKLELRGAPLLAHFMNELVKIILFGVKYYCWSDSTKVLSWLKGESGRFCSFRCQSIFMNTRPHGKYGIALCPKCIKPSRHLVKRRCA